MISCTVHLLDTDNNNSVARMAKWNVIMCANEIFWMCVNLYCMCITLFICLMYDCLSDCHTVHTVCACLSESISQSAVCIFFNTEFLSYAHLCLLICLSWIFPFSIVMSLSSCLSTCTFSLSAYLSIFPFSIVMSLSSCLSTCTFSLSSCLSM